MTTRRETQQRRLRMQDSIRDACRAARWKPGEMVPPMRELAEQYGLSLENVSRSLQALVEEGCLYTVPRVGTFVGQPRSLESSFFLMLHSPESLPPDRLAQVQAGFEERIAQRGGSSLGVNLSTALDYRLRGNLPTLAGVFDFAYQPGSGIAWGAFRKAPRVAFAGRVEDPEHADVVSFDDVDGGRQAAEHLLRLGHRRIAYLGLHSPEHEGTRVWSAEREQGWRAALEQAALSTEGLAFHPLAEPAHGDFPAEIAAICDTALPLVQRPDVTAVVAANDRTAVGLFDALQAAGVPRELWPAVVGFDNLPAANGHVLTSLRLPWDELGRSAADLLWDRSRGHLTGPPVHRQTKMRLIARLTSRLDWSLLHGHVELASGFAGHGG